MFMGQVHAARFDVHAMRFGIELAGYRPDVGPFARRSLRDAGEGLDFNVAEKRCHFWVISFQIRHNSEAIFRTFGPTIGVWRSSFSERTIWAAAAAYPMAAAAAAVLLTALAVNRSWSSATHSARPSRTSLSASLRRTIGDRLRV